jgi:hypothetical protein
MALGFSHDFNNALYTISMYIELASGEEEITEKIAESLRIAMIAVRNAVSRVREIQRFC